MEHGHKQWLPDFLDPSNHQPQMSGFPVQNNRRPHARLQGVPDCFRNFLWARCFSRVSGSLSPSQSVEAVDSTSYILSPKPSTLNPRPKLSCPWTHGPGVRASCPLNVFDLISLASSQLAYVEKENNTKNSLCSTLCAE